MERRMRYLADVVTVRLDPGRCTGCGRCAEVCPHGVFTLVDGTALVADRDGCMECGACAANCASGAIEVRRGVGCALALVKASMSGERQVGARP